MSKILGKIFGNAGGSVLQKLSGVADKFITTGDEKRALQKEKEQIDSANQKQQPTIPRRFSPK